MPLFGDMVNSGLIYIRQPSWPFNSLYLRYTEKIWFEVEGVVIIFLTIHFMMQMNFWREYHTLQGDIYGMAASTLAFNSGNILHV